MDVTPELVRHVAHLARLELSDEELARLQPQLTAILHHVERVQQIECGDADPATQAPVPFETLREDLPGPTLDRRSITRNAPEHDGSFLVVPRILEEQ